MRSVLILVALVLALPATARAGFAVPEEVVPGEPVVVAGEAGVAGSPVKLSVELPNGGFGRAVGGVVGLDGVARFAMPAVFECSEGCTGEQRFLPGQRVGLTACTVPVVTGTPAAGLMASSVFCLGGSSVVGGRVRATLRGRVEPRRAGVLRSARWTSWGAGTARARGFAGGRRATAVASGLVDCPGGPAYSTLTIRQEGRALQSLRLAC